MDHVDFRFFDLNKIITLLFLRFAIVVKQNNNHLNVIVEITAPNSETFNKRKTVFISYKNTTLYQKVLL